MSHVFISYVRENQKEVDRLHDDLPRHFIRNGKLNLVIPEGWINARQHWGGWPITP